MAAPLCSQTPAIPKPLNPIPKKIIIIIQNSIHQLIFIINQNNNKKNSLNFCTMMLECAGIRNPSDVTIWISGSGNSRCPYMSSGTELADWTAAIG